MLTMHAGRENFSLSFLVGGGGGLMVFAKHKRTYKIPIKNNGQF